MKNSRQAILLLGLLGLLFYSTSWNNYFVSDDYHFVGRISFSESAEFFSESWGYGNEYRPVLPFTYALDSTIGGESPTPFHITNTLLHLAIAVLLGMSAYNFGVPFRTSVLASILFSLNPVVHESVIWISGRPVLLGAFFIMLSVWAFSKYHSKQQRGWYIASLLLFLLGLLSYEGAVSLPFLLGIILLSRQGVSWRVFRLIVPYLLLLLVYVIFWNALFHGDITRFPVESTLSGALGSFGTLLKRIFFGSSYGIPASFYTLIFLNFILTSKDRKLCLLCLTLIIAGYLPFFIVQGYADRFAYVASIPAAVLLSWMILHVGWGRFQKIMPVILAACFIAYFGYSMQIRIGQWRYAGNIARNITTGLKQLRPSLPPGAVVYIEGVPEMYKDAYVFITGLEPAVQRAYAWTPVQVVMNTAPLASEENLYHFRHSGGIVSEIYAPD